MRTVVVNHNTSDYVELALRSLLALNPNHTFDVTILDNSSTDDTASLFAWAQHKHMRVMSTGFDIETPANTHGEVLANYMLDSPPGDLILVLDADVCFLSPNTITEMSAALDNGSDLFGVQAEMLLFVTEALGVEPRVPQYIGSEEDGTRRRLFPRPHPFCLLLRDTPTLRLVLEHVGLSPATRHAAGTEVAGSYDTFGLAAAALATHGLQWDVAGGPVLHYAQAAERRDPPELMQQKDEDCQLRLATFRLADTP